MPNSNEAIEWLAARDCPDPALNLALAGFAPLSALESSDDREWQAQRKQFCEALARTDHADPIALAESVLKIAPTTILRWLQTWIYDLASLKTFQINRYHADQRNSQNNINKNIQYIELMNFYTELNAARRLIHHPLNPKLVWESLFIKYFMLFK